MFIFRLIILFGIVAIVSSSTAQDSSYDILYLKNGSVIKGNLMEYIPFKTVKIQTADGSIFVYKSEECQSIKVHSPAVQQYDAARIDAERLESLRIKRNTVPEKFSKRAYYAGILDIGVQMGTSKYDDRYYVLSDDFILLTNFHYINGVKFLDHYYLGIGTGLNVHLQDEIIDEPAFVSIPLYLNFRYYFLDTKTRPYVSSNVGFLFPVSYMLKEFDHYHTTLDLFIGVKTDVNARRSINIGLGYTVLFNNATLVTENYTVNTYSYMQHDVINSINMFNLKVGVVF